MHEHQGLLLINKPADVSSYDCIRRLQKILGIKKRIGHAGTLDPFATGLLIVAIGRQATKHIQKIMELDKEYVATGKFGILTDTLDATGAEIEQCVVPIVSVADFEEVTAQFTPYYIQTPPVFSALRHQGSRLYDLARRGTVTPDQLAEIAVQKQRVVQIYQLEILDMSLPFFTIRARVSHGTYIRSLVNDIARALGSCATTVALERSSIGPFALTNAFQLEKIKDRADLLPFLIPIDEFLRAIQPDY